MTLVLRVLSGRLAGSEVPLVPASPVTIGHSFDNAVVLRDAATPPIRLTLDIDADGCGWIEIGEGSVELLGQTIAAPARAQLPAFIPLGLGQFTLAWGAALSPRWEEADALARPANAVALAPVSAGPATRAAMLDRWKARLMHRDVLLAGGVALSLLFLARPLGEAITAQAAPIEGVRAALAADFPGLRARATPSGRVVVTGTVDSDTERARVHAALDRAGVAAQVAVTTGPALADATAQIFRQSGVSARAQWLRDGVVRIETAPMPGDLRARLVNLALGDVPGVKRIEIAGPDTGPLAGANLADAVAKRVASVVDGDPGFILTADGSRYFPGGLLPTGHRLVSIVGREVTVERGGVTSHLNY